VEGKERRLSLSEAADALGISEITARRWIKSGKLRALHPGRNYQIPESAVEELLDTDPKEAEPFTLDWARAASDAEFYRLIVSAPEEDIDRLDRLSGELVGFVYRGLKRVLAERNGNSFKDHGPEPEPGEYKPMKKRQEALTAEVRRRRPPFARMRMADDGNKCFWFIPPDEWESRRDKVDAFFDGEPYEDVDAREEVVLHEEDAALA
jgi:excisionase family DNA binding protein